MRRAAGWIRHAVRCCSTCSSDRRHRSVGLWRVPSASDLAARRPTCLQRHLDCCLYLHVIHHADASEAHTDKHEIRVLFQEHRVSPREPPVTSPHLRDAYPRNKHKRNAFACLRGRVVLEDASNARSAIKLLFEACVGNLSLRGTRHDHSQRGGCVVSLCVHGNCCPHLTTY